MATSPNFAAFQPATTVRNHVTLLSGCAEKKDAAFA